MAKEYIEREAVIAVLWYNQDECGSAIVSDIEAIPAADAREVVTCAKCRYYSEKRKECGHVNGVCDGYCKNCKHSISTPNNDIFTGVICYT